jgi:hypothetical protein
MAIGMMKNRQARLAICALAGLLPLCIWSTTAQADQSPVGCNSNSLELTISKSKTTVMQGDSITYSLYVSNLNSGSNVACDVTAATVVLHLPAADGTPTGTSVTLASGASYPAGTNNELAGSTVYTVDINPNVTDIVAEGTVGGMLHDAPVNHPLFISKSVGTAVTPPPTASPPPSATAPAPKLQPGLPNTGTGLLAAASAGDVRRDGEP